MLVRAALGGAGLGASLTSVLAGFIIRHHTTNSLEGGINAQLKLLARTHRGRSGERQRRMLDWWLYLKTELPDDPVRIARQSNWCQGQLAKVSTLTRNENQVDHETGRPALYDNAIDTNYTHSIGIQKGHI